MTFGPTSGLSKEELDSVKIEYPDAPQRAVRHSLSAYPTLIDLELVLVRAPEQLRFVCSDNPVVLFNQLLNHDRMGNNTGYAARGLQIFLPLDPNNLLIFFDPGSYALPSAKTYTANATKRDVEHLNALQVASAQDNFYFHPDDVDAIPSLYDHAKIFRRPLEGKVEMVSEEETATGKSQLIMFTSSDVRSSLDLSFLRLTKRGKAFRLFILTKSHSLADRMRSTQLLTDAKDFEEAVTAGKYQFHEIERFLQDRYGKKVSVST
jgi:hypothetical protein